jgi:mannose-6-phosphate isomerase
MKIKYDKRPWGKEEWFITKEPIQMVKILTFKPNYRCSLQYHNHRKEFWRILEGSALVTIGKKKIKAKAGDMFEIMKKQIHRIQGLSKGVRILEIHFGKFNESDIVRLEDDYKRK